MKQAVGHDAFAYLEEKKENAFFCVRIRVRKFTQKVLSLLALHLSALAPGGDTRGCRKSA